MNEPPTQNQSTANILNQFEFSPTIATSGQPQREQFADIAAAGYEVIINLAMPDHEHSIADEGAIVTGLGMSYIHIPVPFDAPGADHLVAFTGYMKTLQNHKVWVHCIVNARVSAFFYPYLQQELGWSQEQATSPVLAQWLPTMDATWQRFISVE